MERVWGTIVIAAVLLGVGSAGHGIYADTVELSNGDTLTGEIVERSERGVVLKHPVLGTLAIGADRIKRVGNEPAATDLVPQAQPQPDPDQSPKTPAEKTEADKVKQQAEAAAAKERPNVLRHLLKQWDSRLTLGLNGAGGNTDRQNYYAKFATKYEDGRDRWTANAQWFYGVAEGVRTQNQFDAELTKDWLQQDGPWFFFLKGRYKYDANRNWENRTSGFGGGGYTLAKTEDIEINTRLGFGGTYEYGNINEFTPEALFGGSVVQWKVTDRATLAGETTYYPSLEDSAVFRIESQLEWVYKLDLARGLSLKLGVENEYDSNTPNDTGNNDIKYYGALVLSF